MDIFCFGDSHARYFKKANILSWAGIMSGSAPHVIAFDYVAASDVHLCDSFHPRRAHATRMFGIVEGLSVAQASR